MHHRKVPTAVEVARYKAKRQVHSLFDKFKNPGRYNSHGR